MSMTYSGFILAIQSVRENKIREAVQPRPSYQSSERIGNVWLVVYMCSTTELQYSASLSEGRDILTKLEACLGLVGDFY